VPSCYMPKNSNIAPIYADVPGVGRVGIHRCTPVKNWEQGGLHAKSGPKDHPVYMSNLRIQERHAILIGLDAFEAQEVSYNLSNMMIAKADESDVMQFMGTCNEGGNGVRVFRGGEYEGFKLMMNAAEASGYRPMLGKSLFFGLDGAADNFYKGRGVYELDGDPNYSEERLFALYEKLMVEFPLYYVEDAFASRDEQWHKWAELTERYGERCHIVADDIATTNARLVRPLIRRKIANNLLLKLNQIGSLMEGWRAARTAHTAGWYTTSSHRSQSGMDTMEVEVHLALAIPEQVRNLFGKWGGANLIERANRYLFEQLAIDEFASGAQSFDPIDPSRKIRIAMPFKAPLNTGKQTLGLRFILDDGRVFESVVPAGTSTGETETSIMPLDQALPIAREIISEFGLIDRPIGDLPEIFEFERQLLSVANREAKRKGILSGSPTPLEVFTEAETKKALGGNVHLAFGLVINRISAAKKGLPAWLNYRLAGLELDSSLSEDPLDDKSDHEFYSFLM
jgi:enolase